MKTLAISLGTKGGTVLYAQHFLKYATFPIEVIQSKYEEECFYTGPSKKLPLKNSLKSKIAFLILVMPLELFRVVYCLVSKKYDRLFILGSHWFDIFYVILFRCFKKNVIYLVHEPTPREGLDLKFFIGKTIKWSTRIIFLSEKTAEKAIGFHSINKPILISQHGLFETSSTISKLKTNKNNCPTFLLIGHINQYKGVNILRKAMDIIPNNIYNKIIIAGSFAIPIPDQHKKLEVINEYLSNDKYEKLMHQADFILMPYTSASQSGVAAQAIAYETPTIYSDIGGLKEQFGNEGGIVLTNTNDKKLAEAIIKACEMTDEEYQSIVQSLRRQKEKLSWPQLVKDIEEFILNN